jgi:hypothetical protein
MGGYGPAFDPASGLALKKIWRSVSSPVSGDEVEVQCTSTTSSTSGYRGDGDILWLV